MRRRLTTAIADLAARLPAFIAPPLRLAQPVRLLGTDAVESACPAIDRLAAFCVSELDRFRAPPSSSGIGAAPPRRPVAASGSAAAGGGAIRMSWKNSAFT